MSGDDAASHPEIVIIRRKSADDLTAGKGGAWKIAYADFVTAMMAFFLVMWLINASNEATRAQVASYFNPIKLTDSATGNRGLRDRKDRKTTDSEGAAPEASTSQKAAEARHEAEIMADPIATLDKIVANDPAPAQEIVANGSIQPDSAASTAPSEMTPGIGDPFDPRSSHSPSEPVSRPADAAQKQRRAPAAEPIASGRPEASPAAPPMDEPPPVQPNPAGSMKPLIRESAKPPGVEERKQPEAVAKPVGEPDNVRAAAAMTREIAAKLGTGLDQLPPSIEVKAVNEGVLISLTDTANFGMFRTGSAEPEPGLVKLVDAVAATLAGRDGFIVVRGHTDSRPYRNKKYDNWQLSTARAHFAQYMLVRGGLDESRIRRIEGMADRDPRVADDPMAPANRRIEILLGFDKP